ncbi:hypothetical protein BKA66DRAFT_474996 [Pyrenochaeta sp. MPI-SDFR-AT-0127]|nr:hypothetical protein BKA66DRAFT_474996 [Pyrenochaeta sp. MPI-SDFR-AT-0127]
MRRPQAPSLRRPFAIFFLLVVALATFAIAIETVPQHSPDRQQPVYGAGNQDVLRLKPPYPLQPPMEPSQMRPVDSSLPYLPTAANVLRDLHTALSSMQDHYFSLWLGKWTTAIDWTAAVMGTYLSATLSSLSRSIDYKMPGTFDKSKKLDIEAQMVENEINKYFAQSVSYYFGEDHFAIRMQAFDDMLWVVLGWLEATRFIEGHSGSHYSRNTGLGGEEQSRNEAWHAAQFIPAFAHRARVFYELAEQGWDWRLCGGGMTWNPRLLPYKNAITNQLFISASVEMYLHFPGDENCSPFLSQYDRGYPQIDELFEECDDHNRGRYDPAYLASAINGYRWLKGSGMTNDQGLYVDGFHIGGYRQNRSKTTCDERNEMVYTYNQGVILSGLRGLWEATGSVAYLEDGHELIRNVIQATGWTKTDRLSTPSFTAQQPPTRRKSKAATKKQDALASEWHGLGSDGILTELCDLSGRCSQDGQTFKGIFFHHLTAFCTPLPVRPERPGRTHAATRAVAKLHQNSCKEYTAWVVHNAQAALSTRDSEDRFGGWWGAPDSSSSSSSSSSFPNPMPKRQSTQSTPDEHVPENAIDYRNSPNTPDATYADGEYKEPSNGHIFDPLIKKATAGDLNDRGRGRTVETQGSGLAVVRAMWEFLKWGEQDVGLEV